MTLVPASLCTLMTMMHMKPQPECFNAPQAVVTLVWSAARLQGLQSGLAGSDWLHPQLWVGVLWKLSISFYLWFLPHQPSIEHVWAKASQQLVWDSWQWKSQIGG